MIRYENKYGELRLERVAEFVPVAQFKRIPEHNRVLFDLRTAEQIAVITGNRGVQIAFCYPINGLAYVVLHDGSGKCALCRVADIQWTDGQEASDVIRQQTHTICTV